MRKRNEMLNNQMWHTSKFDVTDSTPFCTSMKFVLISKQTSDIFTSYHVLLSIIITIIILKCTHTRVCLCVYVSVRELLCLSLFSIRIGMRFSKLITAQKNSRIQTEKIIVSVSRWLWTVELGVPMLRKTYIMEIVCCIHMNDDNIKRQEQRVFSRMNIFRWNRCFDLLELRKYTFTHTFYLTSYMDKLSKASLVFH